jgi:hypothetical protein
LCRFLPFVVIKVSLPFGHLDLHNIWIRFSIAGQEWNDEEVTVNGDHVEVLLSGFQILDANLDAARRNPLDGKKHPGAFRTTGNFGFCIYFNLVAFRNIRIKRLL